MGRYLHRCAGTALENLGKFLRAGSSVGRTPQWHCGGQGFNSPPVQIFFARVAEPADALDSKSSDRKIMRVRLPPLAFYRDNFVYVYQQDSKSSDRKIMRVLRQTTQRICPQSVVCDGSANALRRRLPPPAI